MAALDRGGTLAIAGIYLTDIPPLSYDRYLFQERQLRSVTSNTRQDAREFLAFAAAHKLAVTTHSYPLGAAHRALADLKAGRFDGAGALVPWSPWGDRTVGRSSSGCDAAASACRRPYRPDAAARTPDLRISRKVISI